MAVAIGRIGCLRGYDDAITAPLHGFQDAADYYRRASAGRLLGDIELPTLVLHAADDPFMPAGLFERLPRPADAVRLEISRHGGHVGFMEWHGRRLHPWLARRLAHELACWADTGASWRSAMHRHLSRSDS
ncbi:alpha/beta fold hydrolase family protein [Billgrantia zhangzhouensis]|uniref:hypothetical protein n=1 Tax=Billgrantia zhangzhouensis TaxID=2733481 RepID=UPI001F3AAE70|nr:hypothetical protein [Halomonas zhangzhouensis]